MICTIDNGLMYSQMRIYCKSKKMSSADKETEREKRDCRRCQVSVRENIIVSERRGEKMLFSVCILRNTAARRRLSIGNDFRANVSEMRSMINVIRGGRAAMSWGMRGRRERETDENRAKKISLENCSLLLAAAIDVPR